SRATPCTIWSLCVTCTSKPKCLLWPRFCVASRNTRGTSWGWSWWRSGMTMTDLTPERLAELRRIAEAAPPGPWVWREGRDGKILDLIGYGEEIVTPSHFNASLKVKGGVKEYIQAFDPTTALALLDEIERLQQKVQRANALAVTVEQTLKAWSMGDYLTPFMDDLWNALSYFEGPVASKDGWLEIAIDDEEGGATDGR